MRLQTFLATGLLFTAALAPGVPAGAAQLRPFAVPSHAVAGEPIEIGPLPGGGPLSLRIDKLRGRSPWLFASYLPVGTVFEARLDAGDHAAPLTFVFWDEGTYRVEAGGVPADIEVSTPPGKAWATLGAFGALAALGWLCGWTAGGLKRPPRLGVAALLALLAVVTAVLPPAGEAAALHVARPGELHRFRVELPDAAAKATGAAAVSLSHVEDRLPLFSFRTRAVSGGIAVAYAFPEGTEYRVDVEVSVPGTALATRSLHVEVDPVQPGMAAQARAFAVLAGWYGFWFLAALALRRRRETGRAGGEAVS